MISHQPPLLCFMFTSVPCLANCLLLLCLCEFLWHYTFLLCFCNVKDCIYIRVFIKMPIFQKKNLKKNWEPPTGLRLFKIVSFLNPPSEQNRQNWGFFRHFLALKEIQPFVDIHHKHFSVEEVCLFVSISFSRMFLLRFTNLGKISRTVWAYVSSDRWTKTV